MNVEFVGNVCDIRHCYMVVETLSKAMPHPHRKEELEFPVLNVGFDCTECDVKHENIG